MDPEEGSTGDKAQREAIQAASDIVNSLRKVEGVTSEQILGVTDWIDKNNKQDIYKQINQIKEVVDPKLRQTLVNALYNHGGLKEALEKGAKLTDPKDRDVFRDTFLKLPANSED